MGSNHHEPVEVDPRALADARAMWSNFGEMTKFTVVAVIILLGLMAFFLV